MFKIRDDESLIQPLEMHLYTSGVDTLMLWLYREPTSEVWGKGIGDLLVYASRPEQTFRRIARMDCSEHENSEGMYGYVT